MRFAIVCVIVLAMVSASVAMDVNRVKNLIEESQKHAEKQEIDSYLQQNDGLSMRATVRSRMMQMLVFDTMINAASNVKEEREALQAYVQTRLAIFDAAVGLTANSMKKSIWEIMREIVVRQICVTFNYAAPGSSDTTWKTKLAQTFMIPKSGALSEYYDDGKTQAYNQERSAVIFDGDSLDANIEALFNTLKYPASKAADSEYDYRTILHLLDRGAAYGEDRVFTQAAACPGKITDKQCTNSADERHKLIKAALADKQTGAPGSIRETLFNMYATLKGSDTKAKAEVSRILTMCSASETVIVSQMDRVMADIVSGKQAAKKHFWANLADGQSSHALVLYCARGKLCTETKYDRQDPPQLLLTPVKGEPFGNIMEAGAPFRRLNVGVNTQSWFTKDGLAAMGMPSLSTDEERYMSTKTNYQSRCCKGDETVTDGKQLCPAGDMLGESPCDLKKPGSGCQQYKYAYKGTAATATPFYTGYNKGGSERLLWTSGGTVFALGRSDVNPDGLHWQAVTGPYAFAAGPSGTTDEYFQGADLFGVGAEAYGNCLVRDAAIANMILNNHHTFAEIMQGAYAGDSRRSYLIKWGEDISNKDSVGHQHINDYFWCDSQNHDTSRKPLPFIWADKTKPFAFTADSAHADYTVPGTDYRKTKVYQFLDDLTKGQDNSGTKAQKDLWAALVANTDFGKFEFGTNDKLPPSRSAALTWTPAHPGAFIKFCGSLSTLYHEKKIFNCA